MRGLDTLQTTPQPPLPIYLRIRQLKGVRYVKSALCFIIFQVDFVRSWGFVSRLMGLQINFIMPPIQRTLYQNVQFHFEGESVGQFTNKLIYFCFKSSCFSKIRVFNSHKNWILKIAALILQKIQYIQFACALIPVSQITMSDIEQYIRIIKNWQHESHKKTITNILLRVQNLKIGESQEDLNSMLDALGHFHKQANKANKEKVQEEWFKQVIKSKNHLKGLIEQIKKSQIKTPKLIKSNSHIEYPEEFMMEKSEQYKEVMKSFYKHFLINMDEQITKQKDQITQFLDKVIMSIFEQFGFDKEEKNKEQGKTSQLFERVEAIDKQLARTSSTMAKKEMMQGIIKPELVAKCDPKAFISIQAARIRQERLDAMAKQSETGFYQVLKKNINKDANQQCRFCHKPAAYCESQKQIRAADEPMTRFMLCNLCGKRWRQE